MHLPLNKLLYIATHAIQPSKKTLVIGISQASKQTIKYKSFLSGLDQLCYYISRAGEHFWER